jgi:hypothetical protein
MIERGRSWRRSSCAAGGIALLAGAPLANCSSADKPPNDTFNTGPLSDASRYRYDATMVPDIASSPPEASSGGDDGPKCEAGQSVCAGRCADTNSDTSNCGQCNNQCGTGVRCIGGTCGCLTDAGQAMCNNTCVLTANDQNNCGACGHSCQGNMCSNGLCVPTVVVQPSGAIIYDLAVDSTHIYWTQIATNGNPGGVSKKPFAGSTVTLSVNDPILSDPRGIAVDNLNMYWVDLQNGAVEEISLMGGTFAVLRAPVTADSGVPSDSPIDVRSDGTNVYFVTYDGGQVLSVPIQVTMPLTPPTVIATGENHPQALWVDNTNAYWVDYGNANPLVRSGSVKQAPKTGSGPVQTLSTGEGQPWDIAVDETSVYWTNHGNPGQIRRVAIGGGTVETLADGQGAPSGIAVDKDYVYWTNFDTNTVMRLPKTGGQKPFMLASGQNNPAAIAVDSTNVYWVNQGGTILAVTK